MSVAGSGRSPSTPSNKQRRPPTAAAASAVGLLALVAAWSSVDSLRSSLPLAAPAGAGHSMLAGAGQWRAGQQVPSAIELELEASLQRRQCPPHGNRSNVSFAFLHVPKTAGNFLVKILRRALPADGSGRYCQKRQDYSNHANFPCVERTGLAPQHLQLLADLKANFTTVCSGFNVHQDYGFFQALGIDHSRTLTMVALRHPVERTLSHYYFQMRIMQDNRKNFLFWPKNDSDYSGLIAFGSQQRQQANYHTYMLAGAMGCRWPGGPAPPTSDAEILERAKRNLEKFCVILITEYMDDSVQMLGEATGWPDSVLFRDVRSSNATPRPKVPLSAKRALQAANHLDMQLYEYAVQLFLRRGSQAAAATLQ